MSRISTFAIAQLNEVSTSIRHSLEIAEQWLARFEQDPQCDDADREVIARMRERIGKLRKAVDK